jgi:NAD(P)-dependent dehydrogenase (short-subunit alcohol dehydrogenase family)
LILGASRGLGLAMAEEWLKRGAKVIATQRSASRDLSELQGRYPGSLEIETVDIVEAASVHALRERLGGHRIDVLFVNAGICKAHEETPCAVDERDFVDMMLTNALGPMRAVELLENLVPANGAIAVMTSELGSIAGNRGFWELYSSSKAALNMLMKCFSARHAGDPRALLLIARQAGSAPTWGPRPQRSRSRKASRSSWKMSSAVAAGPACASSTATVESCPGDSKANGGTYGNDHHLRCQHPAP